MKCKKCMDSCFWYLSLELGAYLICLVFLLTSASLAVLGINFVVNMKSISPTMMALNYVVTVLHMVLFLASLTLLYGLCCFLQEKLWPLLVFVPVVVINGLNEIVVIIYIIINRSTLPDSVISAAAGQAFLLVSSVFAAAEVFSLYESWRENRLEEQRLSPEVS